MRESCTCRWSVIFFLSLFFELSQSECSKIRIEQRKQVQDRNVQVPIIFGESVHHGDWKGSDRCLTLKFRGQLKNQLYILEIKFVLQFFNSFIAKVESKVDRVFPSQGTPWSTFSFLYISYCLFLNTFHVRKFPPWYQFYVESLQVSDNVAGYRSVRDDTQSMYRIFNHECSMT